MISSSSLKVTEDIQLLHECKADQDEHLQQFIAEIQTNSEIDPMLIPNYYQDDENIEEDDPEQLPHMVSIINQATNDTYSISTSNLEQRYLDDTLQAIDKIDRFALLNAEYDPM